MGHTKAPGLVTEGRAKTRLDQVNDGGVLARLGA
jgi:hypothetical protein